MIETAVQRLLEYNHIQILLVSLIGISGVFLIVWAGSQFRKRHLLRSGFSAGCGGILLTIAAIFITIISNLYTYQRLTHERVIAELNLSQIGPQHFLASIKFSEDSEHQLFELKGDEWQIDARILKWKYPVIWLGLDSHFQFDRISGRYADIDSERSQARTVYSLKTEQTLDVWPVIRNYQDYIPWIDALYGNASYLPMRDRAQYEISISQTGLIARPLNAANENNISTWR